jgi:hypothetical protein
MNISLSTKRWLAEKVGQFFLTVFTIFASIGMMEVINIVWPLDGKGE